MDGVPSDTREDRILDLFEERRKLQERAGVARALDRLEDPGPSPKKREAYKRAVRELYFGIGDLDTRRRLIAMERRLDGRAAASTRKTLVERS